MGVSGANESKPVKIARRIVEIHKIEVPFDLDNLVEQYAKLIYRKIPIDGVDGVTLNLKSPGKRPTIIVNSDKPKTRQRFTLAHELGHIIIPWHVGTIVDDIYSHEHLNFQYWYLEQEANSFAAELLMPKFWVEKEYLNYADNLEGLHFNIARQASVSDHAAAIRLIQILPPEIVFVMVEDGIVRNTGRSVGSTAMLPKNGSLFNKNFYTHVKNHSIHNGQVDYHWFDLNAKVKFEGADERTWRDVLDEIVVDIKHIDPVGFKKSINGIVSNGHSHAKRNPNYSLDSVIISITNRLQRDELSQFLGHKDFKTFIHKRAYDFYNGIKK